MSEEFSHTKGLISLICGILSLVFCGCGIILGPAAIFLSNGYQSECIVAGVEPEAPGKFGKILGIVGTVLSLLIYLLWILYIVVAVVFGAML